MLTISSSAFRTSTCQGVYRQGFVDCQGCIDMTFICHTTFIISLFGSVSTYLPGSGRWRCQPRQGAPPPVTRVRLQRRRPVRLPSWKSALGLRWSQHPGSLSYYGGSSAGRTAPDSALRRVGPWERSGRPLVAQSSELKAQSTEPMASESQSGLMYKTYLTDPYMQCLVIRIIIGVIHLSHLLTLSPPK